MTTYPGRAMPRRALVVLALLAVAGVPAAVVAATRSDAPRLPGAPRCTVFPASNPWNRRVDRLAVRSDSARLIASIGAGIGLHPDFGTGRIGIPYAVVSRKTPRVRVSFDYADESDRGPYPIPAHPPIEAGSDRHILLVDRDACRLYAVFPPQRWPGGGGPAGSGAAWGAQ